MKARCAVAAFAFALSARPAAAEEGYAFRLSYGAPDGCPTAEAFSAEVTANSTRAHRASPGEAATEVDALASAREGGFLGTLRIRRPDGTETTRSVPAPTCHETTSAMAFMAAIAIDPDAANPKSLGESPVVAGSLPLAEPSPVPAPVAAPVAPNANPKAAIDVPPHETNERKARSWFLDVDAGVGLTTAIAPDVSLDFGGGLALGATQKTLLSPLVLLSVYVAQSPSKTYDEGTAQFQRLTGRLTGCPLRLDAAGFTFRPCARFEAGQLSADSSRVPNETPRDVLWLAVGASARGELQLAGPLTLALDVGAIFPLVHDSFFFKPSRNVIFQIPYAGFAGALELGLRIL